MIKIFKARKLTVFLLVITLIAALFTETGISAYAAEAEGDRTAAQISSEKAEQPVGDPDPEPPTNDPTEPFLSLDVSTLTLGVNETYQLTAATNAEGVIYSVEDDTIADISEDGLVQPKETGTTKVICTAGDDLRAECVLNVMNEAESLTLSVNAGKLGVGERCNVKAVLPAESAAFYKTFTSSDETIATVEPDGVVTSLDTGTVTITCTLQNGANASCDVKILPPATTVTLNTTIATLAIGETFDLNSSVPSGTATAYRYYYTDDSAIAKVTKSGGIITAASQGTTVIRCITGTGAIATVDVTVTDAPTKLTLKSTASQIVGKKYSLTVSTDKGIDNGRFFKWKSSNPSVVTISYYKNNVATLQPKSLGTSTITVTGFNGKTATYKVAVKSSIVKLIDVSTWQGSNIDFKKVKASGINYVIIRAGFGSTKDNQFENNYKKAKAAGMKVGVYWFSYSTTVAGGTTEANACLKYLKGKTLDLPVYYDLEYYPALQKLGTTNYKKMAYNFCETVKKAGFKPGVYASASDYTSFFSPKDFYSRGYSVWNAHWAKCTKVSCDVWQYSEKGKVPGISTAVDMNFILNTNNVY